MATGDIIKIPAHGSYKSGIDGGSGIKEEVVVLGVVGPGGAIPLWQTDLTTLQNAAAANGNGTALTTEGFGGAAIQITGTFSATVNFEGTLNGTDYVAVEAVNLNDGSKATSTAVAGLYLITAPVLSVRTPVSGYVSGAVTVKGRAIPNVPSMTGGDVQLATSDVAIGAVELKDATTDTRAKVAASTSLAETDNAVAVKDPVTGVTTGAAVTSNAAGTLQQYLRGLVTILSDSWDDLNNRLNIAIKASDIAVPTDIQTIYRAQAFATTTVLGASASYTSATVDGLNYRRLTGRVYADQAGTLYLEHSDDDVTWDVITTISVAAGDKKGFDEPFYLRYGRARYVNGATAQTAFRLSGYKSAQ